MNFQSLLKVETADNYIQQAMKQAVDASKRVKDTGTLKKHTRINKSKNVELEKVKAVNKSLTKNLLRIITAFPSLDQLPPFYNELVKTCLDYGQLKKSLGAVKWAASRVNAVHESTVISIKRTRDIYQVNAYRRQFMGRAFSFLKQIKKDFIYIDEARKIMKSFPNIKTSIRTIAIAGHPNVGKSTLLKALTTSEPEIKAYPFTTKTINIGYLIKRHEKIQLVDTPGALDRSFEKMNNIELHAALVLKHVSEKILFVIDPTEICGYTIEKQISLLKRTKTKFKQPIIVLINKSDLKEEWVTDVSKKLKSFKTVEISAEKSKDINKVIDLI